VQNEPVITERAPKPHKGDVLTLMTSSVAFEGKAVSRRADGYVVFIEGALANETVEAQITRVKSSFAEASTIKIVEQSPERREPICPYFGPCGGCSLQHMEYEAQLAAKTVQVREVFERIGKIANPPVHDTLGDPAREYHYRNKMEFSFSEERWLTAEEIASGDVVDRFALGLHVRGRYDRVLDTEVCFIAHSVAPRILAVTRAFTRENDLQVFDPDTKSEGLMRFLVVRTSVATDEVMVNIVTSRFEDEIMQRYAQRLRADIPEITTIVNNVNSRRAQVAQGEKEYTIYGSGFITDRIGEIAFRISANSFFQTNTKQAELLYQVGKEYADLKPNDIVWDLYCGTGTIASYIAPQVKSVLGIEMAESAISDAKENAKRNAIANVKFLAGDLRKVLLSDSIPAAFHAPNALMIDPPRSGMHPDVIKTILDLAPERISYISCNPATQARDVALLLEKYDLLALQPVDMFPQTWHIECVAKLVRR
jgi:23S rRNA (uracil1939-C5)-methyltransferase